MWRSKNSAEETLGKGRTGKEPFSQIKSFASSTPLKNRWLKINYHKYIWPPYKSIESAGQWSFGVGDLFLMCVFDVFDVCDLLL